MRIQTEFTGSFKLNKIPSEKVKELLHGLANTKRLMRDPTKLAQRLKITKEECINRYGKFCEYYFEYDNDYGQTPTYDIINMNEPPLIQPGLWCDWIYNKNTNSIEWNGNVRFYNYSSWIKYLIEYILNDNNIMISGTVYWKNDLDETGSIIIDDNDVKLFNYFSTNNGAIGIN